MGSGCGLKLGRQFDWRLRCSWDGVVRVIDGTPGSCCDQGLLGTWALSAGLEQDADVMLCRMFGSNWFFVRWVACLRWPIEPMCKKKEKKVCRLFTVVH